MDGQDGRPERLAARLIDLRHAM